MCYQAKPSDSSSTSNKKACLQSLAAAAAGPVIGSPLLHVDIVANLNNLAISCLEAGDRVKAEQCFRQALDKASAVTFLAFLPATTLPSLEVQKDKNNSNDRIGLYDEGMKTFSKTYLLSTYTTTNLHVASATVLFNLGQLYLQLQECDEASRYFLRALQVLQWWNRSPAAATATPVSKPGMTLSVTAILHNIGRIQYQAGNFSDAVQTYTKALQCVRDTITTNSHSLLEMAATLNCLGVAHFLLPKSEADTALKLYLEALALYKAVYGSNAEHLDIATVLNNIGRVYYLQGEHAQAIVVYQKALWMRRKLLGENHLDVAATLFNTGQTHHQQGQLDQAMEQYAAFVRIATAQLGPQHRDVAIVLKSMAQIHHERKHYAEGIALYQQALAVGKAALGKFHPEVASILNRLGNLLYEQGDYNAAILIYQQGLQVERAVLNVYDPNIVVTLTNIGQIYKHRGEYSRALTIFEEAVEVQRHTLGSSHPQVADTLSSIAMIHYKAKNYSDALDVYQEALRIRLDTHGDHHLDVSSTLKSIGLVLFKMQVYDLALQSFHHSLRIRQELLGPQHRDVAIILYNIATIHLEQGQEDEAMDFYRQTLEVERQALGWCHKDVVMTMQRIGQVHQQRGELSEALACFRQVLDIQKGMMEEQQTPECAPSSMSTTVIPAAVNSSGAVPASPPPPATADTKDADEMAIAESLNLIGNLYLQRGNVQPMMQTFTEALRRLQRVGKTFHELDISGYNLYGLSKMHPECAPVA